VNKLAVNLPSKRVNHGYLKVLVVAEATLAPVLDKLFAVKDCLGVGVKLNANLVPHRNAIFHIEEKLLHGDHFDCCVGCQPSLVLKQLTKRHGDLSALIPLRSDWKQPGKPQHLAARVNKIRHGLADLIIRPWTRVHYFHPGVGGSTTLNHALGFLDPVVNTAHIPKK
jgi:hypothetical protein